jgi:hypothetical protein
MKPLGNPHGLAVSAGNTLVMAMRRVCTNCYVDARGEKQRHTLDPLTRPAPA